MADELDDAGPITLGEIRRWRGISARLDEHEVQSAADIEAAQARLDRHRADLQTLSDAVITLAKFTGYGAQKEEVAPDGGDPVSAPVPEP